jgi:hypothetical protein
VSAPHCSTAPLSTVWADAPELPPPPPLLDRSTSHAAGPPPRRAGPRPSLRWCGVAVECGGLAVRRAASERPHADPTAKLAGREKVRTTGATHLSFLAVSHTDTIKTRAVSHARLPPLPAHPAHPSLHSLHSPFPYRLDAHRARSAHAASRAAAVAARLCATTLGCQFASDHASLGAGLREEHVVDEVGLL